MKPEDKFWITKNLEEMNPSEWESLCDGCSKCCLFKFIDPENPKKVKFTNVVCRYMNMETCLCADYENRHENVPDCVFLTPKIAREANWLPKTCAYRLVAEGKDLPWYHPLITGKQRTTKQASGSVFGKVIREDDVDPEDLEDMVVNWFD